MQLHKGQQLQELLSPLYTNLKRAELAYESFLGSGKQFCYAQILFECNTNIADLLRANAHLIPAELEPDSLMLLEYLDEWKTKWIDHRLKHNPSDRDVFHFENANRFPRASAKKFEDAFHALRLDAEEVRPGL